LKFQISNLKFKILIVKFQLGRPPRKAHPSR
jgi:hypothetical protein